MTGVKPIINFYIYLLFYSFLYWRYFRSVIVVRKIYGYASSKVAYSKTWNLLSKGPGYSSRLAIFFSSDERKERIKFFVKTLSSFSKNSEDEKFFRLVDPCLCYLFCTCLPWPNGHRLPFRHRKGLPCGF